MSTKHCRGPSFAEFKAGVASRYSVPVSNISFFDNSMQPIADSTMVDSVSGQLIANIKEIAVHGHPAQMTSWIFEFSRK